MAVAKWKNVKDDTVVVVMGRAGSGKTTFIGHATQQGGVGVGHSLNSSTSDVRAVRVSHRDHSIVLVDTPGFDDTYKSDTEILKLIAEWLEKTYKKHIKIAGIIYLHRISDNRMAGTPLKNLRMFGNLCGDDAVRNVILATTMWTQVESEVGTRRELELHKMYWKGMLDLGSSTARFLDSYESAWGIIEVFLKKDPADALLLQEEMVDLQKRLGETHAGKMLYTSLQKLLADQQEALRKLQEEAKRQNNEDLVKELTDEYERVQELLRLTFDQIQEIKIPPSRRILAFFTFRKGRAPIPPPDRRTRSNASFVSIPNSSLSLRLTASVPSLTTTSSRLTASVSSLTTTSSRSTVMAAIFGQRANPSQSSFESQSEYQSLASSTSSLTELYDEGP